MKTFVELGKGPLSKYSNEIEAYQKHIVPFEIKRMR